MYVQYHKITLFSIEDKRCFVSNIEKYCALLTGLTRLELATSAVTGRCSNQLNYSPKIQIELDHILVNLDQYVNFLIFIVFLIKEKQGFEPWVQ